jgi:hypothetical protein
VEGMSLLAVSFKIDACVRDNLGARLAMIANAAHSNKERRQHALHAA